MKLPILGDLGPEITGDDIERWRREDLGLHRREPRESSGSGSEFREDGGDPDREGPRVTWNDLKASGAKLLEFLAEYVKYSIKSAAALAVFGVVAIIVLTTVGLAMRGVLVFVQWMFR